MQRLKELRLKRKLLQKDIAAILGVERTTYVKYENGVSEPGFEMMKKLADYFNVSVDYLLDREAGCESHLSNSAENEEFNEYIDVLKTRPEIKRLVAVSIKAAKKDVEDTILIIEALMKRSGG